MNNSTSIPVALNNQAKTINQLFIIVKRISVNEGHGDTRTEWVLAVRGYYGELGPHPAFQSSEEAHAYLKAYPENYALEVTAAYISN